MNEIYYNPSHSASYGGVKPLSLATGKSYKKTLDYLSDERSYTLHKPSRRNLKNFRKYRAPYFGYQYQADLIDFQKVANQNRGYKYILTCIDIFSRYAWAIPLKSKKGSDLLKAFDNGIDEKPMYLQTDLGTEFYNAEFKKYLKNHNIKLFSVHSPQKASIVERLNKTLKTKLYRYFTHKNTKNWISVLASFVKSYNNTIHSTIKMKPLDAIKTENNAKIRKIHAANNLKVKNKASKLKVDDYVRISKRKSTFAKGYSQNWSEEIYQIHSIDKRYAPTMFTLKDYTNNIIVGKFYALELQLVKKPTKYPIEKIYKQQNGKYLVKFLSYPEKYWVDELNG